MSMMFCKIYNGLVTFHLYDPTSWAHISERTPNHCSFFRTSYDYQNCVSYVKVNYLPMVGFHRFLWTFEFNLIISDHILAHLRVGRYIMKKLSGVYLSVCPHFLRLEDNHNYILYEASLGKRKAAIYLRLIGLDL